MKSERAAVGMTMAAVLLAMVIIVAGIVLVVKLSGSPPVEITLTTTTLVQGEIYIGGEVSNPGYYPIRPGDNINDILRAAGGPTDNSTEIRLTVGASDNFQKVDINRAEVWLLEALPGVGETKAQAIIAYREQHGRFRDIHELMNVPGFGEALFQAIQDKITVSDSSSE